ncbi:MAG: tetratricopeptide repeat protein [Planctomycetota bacterium]|nr:tetratricopeptide repeat protein [Planctomycetota bacterium]
MRYVSGTAEMRSALSALAAGLCAAAISLAPAGCGRPRKSTLDDPHLQSLFSQGCYYLRHGKYEAARKKFEEVLVSDPELTGVLLNAGDACYLSGDYDAAAGHYKALLKLRPDEWPVMARLIQAYEAAGKREEADRAVAELYAMRGIERNRKLRSAVYFVRDRMKIAGLSVEVMEFFDRKGREFPLWEIHCRDGKSGRIERILHVDRVAGGKGERAAGETLLYEGVLGKGSTYSKWEGIPTYPEAKERIVAAIREHQPQEAGEGSAGERPLLQGAGHDQSGSSTGGIGLEGPLSGRGQK